MQQQSKAAQRSERIGLLLALGLSTAIALALGYVIYLQAPINSRVLATNFSVAAKFVGSIFLLLIQRESGGWVY